MHPSADHKPTTYEIRLAGHLDGRWAARFDGFALRHDADGTTVLSGPLVDQAALHGLLQQVRDLGVPLVSITRLGTESAALDAASDPPAIPERSPR